MIYDCFTFFNELDLLEIRLNYLYDHVDKFVLVEMDKTFTELDKPFYFDENKKRYKKFLDKIIHIKVTDCPPKIKTTENFRTWQVESHQREAIMRGLNDAKDDDIIIISDLDEIPSINSIDTFTSGIRICAQKMMNFYLNNLNMTNPSWIQGTRICRFSELLNPEEIPTPYLGIYFTKPGTTQYMRYHQGDIFWNGGWHFSFLGGIKAIVTKIKSFSHTEYNKEEYTNEERIAERIKKGRNLFGGDDVFKPIPIDDSFPEYIVKNQKKYKHLILDWE